MGLQDLVSWYQKKIGTYDKQQWEKTVEQRILHGLNHILKKTAKLKTDLIDVDLVKGSSFPKAKPKHGFITITSLGIVRWLFLPFYSYWWIEQTSFGIFSLLLTLYILQLSNMIIYFANDDEQLFEHISTHEVLVPVGMLLVLSITHSQIVSTNNISLHFSKSRSKRRRIKRKNFSLENKQEFTRKESGSSVQSKNRTSLNIDTADESSIRRKNIGWCIPLQSIKVPKLSETNDETEEPCEKTNVENRSKLVEDDGFESLSSTGASENGEENQYQQIHQRTSDEETTNGRMEFTQAFPREDVNKKIKLAKEHVYKRPSVVGTKGNDGLKSDVLCNKDFKISLSSSFDENGKRCETLDFFSKNSNHPFSSCTRQPDSSFHNSYEICDYETDHKDTDSDGLDEKIRMKKSTSPQRLLQRRRGSLTLQGKTVQSNYSNSSCESDDGDRFDGSNINESTPSSAEWIGITTNSEECSVTSEIEESDNPSEIKILDDHPFAWEFQMSPSMPSPSCASSDKVSCTIWENNDVKRADLSVLDISSAIIARVETMRESMDYFYVGICVSFVIAFLPSLRRLIEITQENPPSSEVEQKMMKITFQLDPLVDLSDGLFTKLIQTFLILLDTAFGSTLIERFVILGAVFQRFMLSTLFFFLVAVAERTFKQRFLYAKFFSRLTSFRRARKSELPHFRLNKVRNIKTWLSVRSYLKKRGPQRSVDVIVSTAFIITLLLLSFLSVELLKDSMRLHSECNLEAVIWCLVLGVYLLRFMTLGNKTNRKYRNLSVLLTEQINLYLQIEQKPHKKEELMVANSVLKLAADLLKELESPFKISGLSANPYVYTITKVVILSALSGVLSELLGFKLKLHKIKIK